MFSDIIEEMAEVHYGDIVMQLSQEDIPNLPPGGGWESK